MKRISSAAAVALLSCFGIALASLNAAEAEISPSTNRVSTEASKSSLSQPPVPGAVRPLPAAFTKAVPGGVPDLRGMEKHVKNLVSRVAPSVVGLEIGSSEGSGVVISADGLVLTAGHVCGRPDREVKITFPDGKTALGRTVGALESPDCGLLRITDPGPWPYTDIAGMRSPTPGDWVLALGHPGGFDPTRSFVARFGRIVEVSPRAIRTDCTITTGDSGGPLLDMHGRVLGIHSYISNGFDDNYHIPIAKFVEEWAKLVGGKQNGRDTAALNLN